MNCSVRIRSGELHLAMTSERPGPMPSSRYTWPFLFFWSLAIPDGSTDSCRRRAHALTAGCSRRSAWSICTTLSLDTGLSPEDEAVELLQEIDCLGDPPHRETPLAGPTEQVDGHGEAKAV